MFYHPLRIAQPANSTIDTVQQVLQGRRVDAMGSEQFTPLDMLVVRRFLSDSKGKREGQYAGIAYKCDVRMYILCSQSSKHGKSEEGVADGARAKDQEAHVDHLSLYLRASDRTSITIAATKMTTAVKILQLWSAHKTRLRTMQSESRAPWRRAWRTVAR